MIERFNIRMRQSRIRMRQSRMIRRLSASASVIAISSTVWFVGACLTGDSPGPGPAMAAGAINTASEPSRQRPIGFSDVVANVKGAVIGVRARVEEGAQERGDGGYDQDDPSQDSPLDQFFHRGQPQERAPRPHLEMALGSGFFISQDGYAVTNNHVIENGKDFEITTDDEKHYKARVIGTDSKSDVALIKVDGRDDFPFVKFADEDPHVGDWVLAVGNPFGLGGTVTAGIVSAQGRDIGVSAYDDFIQIDAPVNKGNSGGPTFDVDGKVIGVNTAIFSPSGGFVGIAFDIPASSAKLIVQQLKDKGEVTRGWMGVQIQTITPELADSLGLKNSDGALVAEPQANSPAAKAGIEPGDVINAINGKSVKDSHDLAKRIAAMAPASSVELGVFRNGEQKIVKVTLGEVPNPPSHAEIQQPQSQPNQHDGLGLTLTPARRVAGAGSDGVVVTQIDPNGTAAETGIEAGDVITAIGNRIVNTPDDVSKALADARAQAKHSVLLRVKSNGQPHFIAVPVG
jgi:serine protease Do